jgi:predicted nuclease with TOPRIM domain
VGVPPPLNRLWGMPSSVVAALRVLPDIAAHTEAMVAHTAMLERIADGLDRVALDTKVLDALRGEMASVREATGILGPMDERLATMESAMPVLVEVQQHLARVPDTLADLDRGIGRLSAQLERMLGSLEGLAKSVDELEERLVPIGRLASFGRRRNRRAAAADAEADEAPA